MSAPALLPLRMMLPADEPEDALTEAGRRIHRIQLIAEAAECYLEANRGSEIVREEMLEFFGLISEQAQAIMLPELKAATAAPGRRKAGQS